MPSLVWKTDLGQGPALVAAGRAVEDGEDLAASSGRRVVLFMPENGDYRYFTEWDPGGVVTGLTPGKFSPGGGDNFVAATADRISVLGVRPGAVAVLWQSDPEPGADFSSVAAGDLEGDGRDEIAAAAPGLGAVYVYRVVDAPGGGLSVELAGIRAVPGTPRLVAMPEVAGTGRMVAVAYEKDGASGLATFALTEEGFTGGPSLEGLPFSITALAAGDFSERPGSELALGGAGGMVWLVGTGPGLEVLLITDSLGTAVPALAPLAVAKGDEAPPGGSEKDSLAAGTPEGNVFVFNYPVGKKPDLAFSAVVAVTGLAGLQGGRVAVGTSLGDVQVWALEAGGQEVRYIVRPGETLWTIAGKFGVTVESIVKINENIRNRDFIMPGQVIKIPGRGGA